MSVLPLAVSVLILLLVVGGALVLGSGSGPAAALPSTFDGLTATDSIGLSATGTRYGLPLLGGLLTLAVGGLLITAGRRSKLRSPSTPTLRGGDDDRGDTSIAR